MAPALSIHLAQQHDSNSQHTRIQRNRYTHKKYGARCPEIYFPNETTKEQETPQLSSPVQKTTINVKRSGEIFRPYALEDKTTPRKRKHQELNDDEDGKTKMEECKRFAPAITTLTDDIGYFTPCYMFPSPPIAPPASFHWSQLEMNHAILTEILQKQHAAMYMGEILKRMTLG
ncbi:uncharacterized protein LOC105261703 [Musca domestica]|uniref:Uncharacterized protein LOC105261703 n=1 Tax=Musca domestica TaxID=7370 RepID=A0A9J7D4U1_MUSDO|nr:uncharacterized protein LOC105261703 [Musca domestica]XP_058981149.1 uncharacterized protein LOC105261703 [Musca domestica]